MSEPAGKAFNGGMNSAPAQFLADALETRAPSSAHADLTPIAPDAWSTTIAGVPLDQVTASRALYYIHAMIASRRPHRLVNATLGLVARATRDAALHRALLEADLLLCGSAPLAWLSCGLGARLPGRIAVLPLLLEAAVQNSHRVFVLSDAAGDAATAAAVLKNRHPALIVAGTATLGPAEISAAELDALSALVRTAQADILLACFTGPAGETWLARHHRALGVPVSLAIDTDAQPLRPGDRHAFLRALRRRARTLRTLAQPFFGGAPRGPLVAELPARPQEISFAAPEWHHVDAGAELTRRSLERDAAFWRDLATRPRHCLLDAAKLQRVDGTGLAFLIRLRNRLAAAGRQLVLLGPGAALRQALADARLTDYFSTAGDFAEAARQAQQFRSATIQRDGITRSLAWCGEIIAANADDVWRTTTDHIQAFVANQATLVVVDLGRLRFIDSAGAALMLRLKKWAQPLRVEILYAHVPASVRSVLRLTCVEQLLLEGGQ